MIELGRNQTDHMPRETRLCPLCKSNQVENETHFLLQCRKYSLQGQTFFNRINEIIPDTERKSTSESIKLLMNSNDYHVNKLVMKFISLCMNIRGTLLLSSESDVLDYHKSCFVINYYKYDIYTRLKKIKRGV